LRTRYLDTRDKSSVITRAKHRRRWSSSQGTLPASDAANEQRPRRSATLNPAQLNVYTTGAFFCSLSSIIAVMVFIFSDTLACCYHEAPNLEPHQVGCSSSLHHSFKYLFPSQRPSLLIFYSSCQAKCKCWNDWTC